MAMAPMQEAPEAAPMEQPEAGKPSVCVELYIYEDGTMDIEVGEHGADGEEVEGEMEKIPVKDLAEALAKIKQIASALLEQTMTNAPAAQQEDQAFKQEMAA